MELSEKEKAFVARHSSAAMITNRRDGTPNAVRVGAGFIDGKLWSSGTRSRVRTRHLRRDPRSTLWFFDPTFHWLAVESEVTILEGPEAPEQNLRLMRMFQKRPPDSPMVSWFGGEMAVDDFLDTMRAESRLIYQFEIKRAYGFVE